MLKATTHNGQSRQQHTNAPQSLTILGSTGTIGQQTLEVISRHPRRFQVHALTAQDNSDLLAQQAIRYNANQVAIGNPDKYANLKSALSNTKIKVSAGEDAILDVARQKVDCFMAAIVGVAGLRPTYEAATHGTRIALANKECLVAAGQVFLQQVQDSKTTLIPVDSEHSAAFQALQDAACDDINKITLTASGGPFRTWTLDQLRRARPREALNHPTWNMGRKITIDSATLMNKGLELIEAYHLFPVEPHQLDVIVHPQSIIHCLVEFADGSTLAQMGAPDMRTPIAYSLSWPDRMSTATRKLSVNDLATMTFEQPDPLRFPALRIAHDVLNGGGLGGTIFNAANEIAVEAFLSEAIGFMSIPDLVEETLDQVLGATTEQNCSNLSDVFELDHEARKVAKSLVHTM